MSAPSIPPPIAQLGALPFSFYPAILNIQHNQWIYQSATWSEVMVRNTQSNETVAIPRHYVGEVSSVEAPVTIVGLLTELEYRAGVVLPAKKRVIEMPLAVNDSRPPRPERTPSTPAPVVGIRLESRSHSALPRIAVAGVALGVAGCVLAISLYRGGLIASRAFYAPVAQQNLTALDDYHSVARLLGPPAREQWQSDAEGRDFQVLSYPRQRMFVVLMSLDSGPAHYIGALDRSWRPVHTVSIAGLGNSYALLASLRRF
jgi:hypothetical protein